MAIVAIGQISVDMQNPVLNPFPIVALQSGFGYIFILETVPVGQQIDYGYFIPCPFVLFGGEAYEIACRFKWYPSPGKYSLVVPIYDAGGALLNVVMAVKPIEIFSGRASPQFVNVACSYENTLAQPLGFGL